MTAHQINLAAQARADYWDHGKQVPALLFARMTMAGLDAGTMQAKALNN